MKNANMAAIEWRTENLLFAMKKEPAPLPQMRGGQTAYNGMAVIPI
jgi:hypothetical protein